MEREVEQLVEMGATPAQARAALKQYKDVMQAAERIFEGQFDNVQEDVDMHIDVSMTTSEKRTPRPVTPDEDEPDEDDGVEDAFEDDDDMVDDYVDYDSDYETKGEMKAAADADPYSGIFFSKDRREEVIEVEEEPEIVTIPGVDEQVKIMTQSHWMKGCPEGGEQSFLFSLYTQLSQGECPCPNKCGASIPRKKSDFFAIFAEFATFTSHIQKLVRQTCLSCRTLFCFACGEPIAEDRTARTSDSDDPLFHCPNLQGVILGVGLSMLENLFSEQSKRENDAEQNSRLTKKRKVDANASKSKPLPDLDDGDDVYYAPAGGKKAKGGTGYAGNQREDLSGQIEAHAIQRAKDERMGLLLSSIRVYLPSLRRVGGGRTSDYLVHPTALAHLRRRFNCICSSLLRNDSLSDMSDRSVLYFELFEWLETISNHEALASMMAMPIMVVSSVKSVTAKRSSKESSPIRERTIIYEGSSGPRELLEAIVIQAQAAIKGLEGVKPPENIAEEMTEEQKRMTSEDKGKTKEAPTAISDENLRLLEFCQRILATANAIDRSLRETKGDAFVERLHSSLPRILTSSSENVHVDAGATEETAMEAYVTWATRVRFEYCDLTVQDTGPTREMSKEEDYVPHYKFYYNNEARMLANADIPKRSLAIAKELAVLTTNLPVAWNSSIFLKVDETRVDVIKALITGPEGTPYYNGCFLFDIFLGSSYNQSPPSVKYMTTNGGKFRFNPNLYADGKVCLSLLGTWQGPGWVAGKSTLLQVLISIQSMILCEEPYLNEPGWASSGGTPQSIAYSANVRRMVVKTAMLGNLKNPPEPFGDIIRTHFRLKSRSIITQLDQWVAQDDGKSTMSDGGYNNGSEPGASSNDFQKDVAEFRELLRQLQDDINMV